MELSREQRKKYELYRSMDFEYHEEMPEKGLICLRKEKWYGTESVTFDYVTVKKDGSTVYRNLCNE